MRDDEVTDAIDEYCGRLRRALRRVAEPDRREMVQEIRAHLLDRIASEPPPTRESVRRILRAAGDPRELAEEFEVQALLRGAADSRSPWIVLRTTLRWATKGGAGVIALLVSVLGYGCGAVFYFAAVLKPLLPSRIGLWLAPERTLTFGYWNGQLWEPEVYGVSVRPPVAFVLGTMGPASGPVRELLGLWSIPVGLIGGGVLVFATTVLVRWFIKRFRPRDSPVPAVAVLRRA